MADLKSRSSMVRLVLELIEQSIVLVFLEMKLGVMEIKHNVTSAKNGAIFVGIGASLFFFCGLAAMATAVAALALVLPVWLSALIVTAVLGVTGGALLFAGLSKIKHFSIVPMETLHRVETISNKLKKHAEQRELAEYQARGAKEGREAAREAVKEERKEAARKAAAVDIAEVRERRAVERRQMAVAHARERRKTERRQAPRDLRLVGKQRRAV